MATDRDRHELFLALRRHLGGKPAETMMELLPPVGWADVARRSDIELLRVELKQEVAGLELRLAGLETRLVTMNVATAVAVGGLVLAAVRLA